MEIPKPAPLPTCEHGRIDFERCALCYERDAKIREIIKPIIEEFWTRRRVVDLDHLVFRAYRMGMRHGP